MTDREMQWLLAARECLITGRSRKALDRIDALITETTGVVVDAHEDAREALRRAGRMPATQVLEID